MGAGQSPRLYCQAFDAVSVCFAKGLGAPFGSVLLGSRDVMLSARRYRKWFGGALHQAGYMAAAALFAIRNNVERLAEDHAAARLLASRLDDLPFIHVSKPETNIVLIDVTDLGITAADLVARAQQASVGLMAWTPQLVRAVTSMNVSADDVSKAADKLADIIVDIAAEKHVPAIAPGWGADWRI